jgi:hypothetical protein
MNPALFHADFLTLFAGIRLREPPVESALRSFTYITPNRIA